MTPETLFSVSGKTALVTGGATGIGRMVADALVRAGARVMLASRNGEACAEAARALNALNLPGRAEGFKADVGSREGICELATEVAARTDCLDILVNNAGTTWGAPLADFPYEAWDRVMSVNVAGLFELTRKLLPLLNRSGTPDEPARVVNVASVMGEVPMGDGAYSYSASKAAVIHLTRIMARELSSGCITVNALAPGPFVSKMTAFATDDPDTRAQVGRNVPLGRVGRAEDIAGCILFLCGRGGAYVTGAVIPVSGGLNVSMGRNIFEADLKGD